MGSIICCIWFNCRTKTMDTDQTNRPQGALARITNFFGVSSHPGKTLMKWKQSGEHDEWTNKAVDTLVKKLKKQPNGIKNITDVLKAKTEASICVTIPRSVDGRLQVSIYITDAYFVINKSLNKRFDFIFISINVFRFPITKRCHM